MSESDENLRKPEPSGAPGQSTTSVDGVRPANGGDDPLIGQLFSQKYRVLSKVGRGGMSAVYKAIDVVLNRVVALKILLPNVSVDMNGILRFQQEARSASRLNNPHIIKIYEFAIQQDGEPPFLVMDFIEGVTLSELIAQEGAVDIDRCVNMFMQTCDGLMHAHDNGVIHRDLKPSNLMITKSSFGVDFVNIVDFGIAKMLLDEESAQLHLTQTGEVFGSPYYMSPEQCRGEILDRRSDIYALGCVMFETLTGRVPFKATNVFQTMQKHISELPERFIDVNPNVDIPIELEQIVHNALAKSPEDRYQSMHDLYDDLKLFADNRAFVQLTTGAHAGRITTGRNTLAPNNDPANLPATQAAETNAQAEPLSRAQNSDQPGTTGMLASAPVPAASDLQAHAPGNTSDANRINLQASDRSVSMNLAADADAKTGADAEHSGTLSPGVYQAETERSGAPGAMLTGTESKSAGAHQKTRIVLVSTIAAVCLLSLVGYCFVMSPAGSMYIARWLVKSNASVEKLESTGEWMEKQEQFEPAAVCYLAAAKDGGHTRAAIKDTHTAVKILADLRSRGGANDLENILSSIASVTAAATVDELSNLVDLASEQNQSKLYSASEISARLAIAIVVSTPRAQSQPLMHQALEQLQECYFNRSLFKEMNEVFGKIRTDLQPILQDKEPIAYCAWTQATAKFEMEAYADAEPFYREAITTLAKCGRNGSEELAAVYYEQGQNYFKLKRDEDAVASFRNALTICENLGLKDKQTAIRASLAELGAEEPAPQTVGKPGVGGAREAHRERTTHLARRGYQGPGEKHGLSRIFSKAKRWLSL